MGIWGEIYRGRGEGIELCASLMVQNGLLYHQVILDLVAACDGNITFSCLQIRYEEISCSTFYKENATFYIFIG